MHQHPSSPDELPLEMPVLLENSEKSPTAQWHNYAMYGAGYYVQKNQPPRCRDNRPGDGNARSEWRW